MKRTFTRVKILKDDQWESDISDVEVLDHLSEQFTAEVNGGIKFYFYRDKGMTWEPED